MQNQTLLKIGLIVVSSIASVIAQLNLKSTSASLPTANYLSWIGSSSGISVVLRAAFFSGISLCLTWYAYRKFAFLELMVAQSSVYVFAYAANILVYNEEFQPRKLFAIFVILAGITVYNF